MRQVDPVEAAGLARPMGNEQRRKVRQFRPCAKGPHSLIGGKGVGFDGKDLEVPVLWAFSLPEL